jgi:hypothetical protein
MKTFCVRSKLSTCRSSLENSAHQMHVSFPQNITFHSGRCHSSQELNNLEHPFQVCYSSGCAPSFPSGRPIAGPITGSALKISRRRFPSGSVLAVRKNPIVPGALDRLPCTQRRFSGALTFSSPGSKCRCNVKSGRSQEYGNIMEFPNPGEDNAGM